MTEFDVSYDGTFTAGVGVTSLSVASQTQVWPIVGVHFGLVRVRVERPPGPAPQPGRRTQPGIVHAMPAPAVVNGRPTVPKIWGVIDAGGSHAYAGTGHLRGFPDPDPVWDGSVWSTPPPDAPAGANFIRWSARQLPDPSTFPNNHYLLGARVDADGTSGQPVGTGHWHADAGSDFVLNWDSAYPFKPRVAAHVHYGEDGAIHTESAGVHFGPFEPAHMWADFGTILTPPFTVLAVLVITDFPHRNYLNYVFDAGYDPTGALSAGQLTNIWRKGSRSDIKISEAEGYRNGLRVARTQMQGFNDPSPATRLARLPFAHTLRPKMLAMVVDGADSHFSHWDAFGRTIKHIHLADHGAQRLWLMGRKNGVISALAGASMVVFEVRAWDKALSTDHLQAQFDQLSSTWRFWAYNREILSQLRAPG